MKLSLEEYICDGSYNHTLSLAQTRLAKNPNNVEAKIAFGYALHHLGKTNEAKIIFKEILEYTTEVAQQVQLLLDNDAPLLTGEATHVSPVKSGDEETDVSELSEDFLTVSFAELYIKQGYYKIAEDILADIVRRDVGNSDAVKMLQKVQILLNKTKHTEDSVSHQEQIAALEQFLHKIKKMPQGDGRYGS